MDELASIEASIWRELAVATSGRSHPWRVATLATANGDEPDARSVVLREADLPTRCLRFFTDARSAKVVQIGERPIGVLVVWSPALQWQLRLRVLLSVQTDGLAVSSRWARLAMTPAASDYLAPRPPGSPLEDAARPEPDRSSRGHFALVDARVQAIDWLALDPAGHRRARFEDGAATWLVP